MGLIIIFVALFITATKSLHQETQQSTALTLNVGTEPGKYDVVFNGVVQVPFYPGVGGTPYETNKTFYFQRSSPSAPFIVIESFNATIPSSSYAKCSPFLRGFENGTEISFDFPQNLTVYFNCSTNGYAETDIFIGLRSGISFTFSVIAISGRVCKGFQIGLEPPYSDVVYDGLALPLWEPHGNNRKISTFTDNILFSIIMADDSPNQAFGAPNITLSPLGVAEIKVSGSAVNGGTAHDQPLSLDIQFLCQKISQLYILIRIPVTGYNDVYFGFKKDCDSPDISVDIGTTKGAFDIVSHGEVLILWRENIGSAFVSYSVDSTDFYAIVNSEENPDLVIKVDSMNVTSEFSYCSPFFLGILTEINQTSTQFTVVYNCSYTGVNETLTHIKVTIEIHDVLLPIEFWWAKRVQCNNAPIDIGFTFNDSDVVANGIPSAMFQQQCFTYYSPGWRDRTTFYMRLSEVPQTNTLQISNINIELLTPDDDLPCNVSLGGPLVHGGVIEHGKNFELIVDHICYIGNIYFPITINFNFSMYPTLQIDFWKYTGGLRRGFSIGTVPFSCDVVQDGVSLPLWQANLLGLHKTSGIVSQDLFYLTLENPNTEQPFKKPKATGNIAVNLTGDASEPGIIHYNETKVLVVNYLCTTASTAIITITFEIPPFEDVLFQYLKTCGVALYGFNVGTILGFENVVTDGIPSPYWAWEPGYDHVEINENTMATRFYFESLHNNNTVQIVVNSNDSDICLPYLTNTTFHISPTSNYVDLYYNCFNVGTAIINMTISLSGPYLPIHMKWLKLVGGTRMGFEIGTFNNQTDVVMDGITQGNWSNDWTNGTHSIIQDYELETMFYIFIRPDSQYMNYEQVISPPIISFVPPVLQYEIDNYIINNTVSPFSRGFKLIYNCVYDTDAVNITVTIQLRAFNNVTFYFVKKCPPFRKYLQIGTKIFESNVVTNGQALPEWGIFSHTYSVGGNSFLQKFYAMYDVDEGDDVKVTKMLVKSEESNCNPHFTGKILQTISKTPQEFSINYNCSIRGNTTISVVIYLDGVYSSIIFMWRKNIGGLREGFNMGTLPLSNDIIKDGIINPKWIFGTTISDTVWKSQFYIWMDNNTEYSEQIFLQPFIDFSPTEICNFYITGPSKIGGIAILNSENTYFSIIYDCKIMGMTNINLLLEIPPFDNITLNWMKKSLDTPLALYINTTDGSSVVENGQIQSGWLNNNITDILFDTASTSFVMGMANNGTDYLTANVTYLVASADCILTYNNISNATYGVFIGGNNSDTFMFTLYYEQNCTLKGKTLVSVSIFFKEYSDPISFFYYIDSNIEKNILPIWIVVLIILAALVGVFLLFAMANYCIVRNVSVPVGKPKDELLTKYDGKNPYYDLDDDTNGEEQDPLILNDPFSIQSCPDFKPNIKDDV